MLEKSGIKRKIAIFATFAVVLLIGMAFVPAAEGRPDEREPLPEPKPGEDVYDPTCEDVLEKIDEAEGVERIELSEETQRKMKAAHEIELGPRGLYLPEEKAREIGMSSEEKEEFNEELAVLNRYTKEGYITFERNEQQIKQPEQGTLETEQEIMIEAEDREGLMEELGLDLDGASLHCDDDCTDTYWDTSTNVWGIRKTLALNEGDNSAVAYAITGASSASLVASTIIAKTGIGAPVSAILGVASGILGLGAFTMETLCGGCGVEYRVDQAWAGPPVFYGVTRECDDGGGWWPPW